ncbi:hypothetical protein HMPREF3293_00422 [Christensenella minuta]|uniref:Uncharacterized protein n=1 Tax=Christensenella minuta TaxID=626937 RepID=A0A136Q7S2_9FIRM|nr:hypothetical protein HMPREF3293_00422 [Christensenella minuta]
MGGQYLICPHVFTHRVSPAQSKNMFCVIKEQMLVFGDFPFIIGQDIMYY